MRLALACAYCSKNRLTQKEKSQTLVKHDTQMLHCATQKCPNHFKNICPSTRINLHSCGLANRHKPTHTQHVFTLECMEQVEIHRRVAGRR